MTKSKLTKVVKKVVAKKSATKAKGYTLEVSVNDVEYKGSGATMVEALEGFAASKDFPFGVKTRVFMKFSDGKNKGSQVYSAIVGRRVLSALSHKPSAIEIYASKMEERMA